MEERLCCCYQDARAASCDKRAAISSNVKKYIIPYTVRVNGFPLVLFGLQVIYEVRSIDIYIYRCTTACSTVSLRTVVVHVLICACFYF